MIRSKFQIIDIKHVNMIMLNDSKGGPKNEGKSVEVIENKCRKNVSF